MANRNEEFDIPLVIYDPRTDAETKDIQMTAISNPAERQVLVNLGNRYVVFGPETGLPSKIEFDPEQYPEVLPRVADESEVAEQRIGQTMQVHGLVRTAQDESNDLEADLVLSDDEKRQVFVEIKVRESAPKSKEMNLAFQRIASAMEVGKNLEVWYFNIDQLKLIIQTYKDGRPFFCELPPSDVWEKTGDSVYRRDQVVQEVARWESELSSLYEEIIQWLGDRPALKIDQSRRVAMSEELMQKFAVSDKELPVMDILLGDQVVASLVPRALWVIGAWGRIDIITKDNTFLLARRRRGNDDYHWTYTTLSKLREANPFTKEALLAMVTSP